MRVALVSELGGRQLKIPVDQDEPDAVQVMQPYLLVGLQPVYHSEHVELGVVNLECQFVRA